MSTTCTPGKNAGVLCDGFDMQRLLSSAQSHIQRDDIDTTTLGQGDKSNISSLRSGSLSCEGFYLGNSAAYNKLLSESIGVTTTLHYLAYCPEGYAVGKDALIFKSNQNAYEVGAPFSGAVMTSVTWGATGGKRLGSIIATHSGSTAPSSSETQTITFTNADPNQFFALRANGTSPTFAFQTSTTNSAIKAGIEGLAAYSGRTVTITGSLTGSTLKSGTLNIAFDGSVDVPPLEVISGAVRNLVVTSGGTGNYTWHGGANFTLGINEATLQTNQRALTGQYAGVVVKGASAAPSGPTLSFDLTGAGDTTFNGHYVDGGTYNSLRYYTNGSRFLYSDSFGGQWDLSDILGGPGSQRASYPTNGFGPNPSTGLALVDLGTAPAPTIAAGAGSSGSAGSANFYEYFPVSATPAATAATGTGAASTEILSAASLATSVVAGTTNEGGPTGVVYTLVTTTGNGATYDAGALTTTGATAHIHAVYAVGAGASLAVKIQHSVDGTTWADLIIFDVLSGSGNNGVNRKTIDKPFTVNRYRRSVVTAITGTWAFDVILSSQGPGL